MADVPAIFAHAILSFASRKLSNSYRPAITAGTSASVASDNRSSRAAHSAIARNLPSVADRRKSEPTQQSATGTSPAEGEGQRVSLSFPGFRLLNYPAAAREA